ncbi:MAG: CRISPR-associated ring nuclease Csm6 [Desulfosalsimonadaceae bacterium]
MKYILLAVTGLTPQVITETLYALYQNKQRVNEIQIITTRNGREKIYADLLAGETGRYAAFLNEYGIGPASIQFDHDNVHVIVDEYGNEISDIIDGTDNECLLKKCLELTFAFTKDPDTSVFFSIAGGRKTMSSCLTLAAQLYGRPQDRLYHVLVSPEFESNRDFFYPPASHRPIELKDNRGQPYFKDTRFAQIALINLPFISIRDHLSPAHLKEPKDPGTLMLSLIRDPSPGLTVNMISRKIIYKTLELDMMPAHLALYVFFIQRKKDCTKKADACRDCRECFTDWQTLDELKDGITEIYRKICGPRPVDEMSDSGITNLTLENFNSLKSKIKTEILSKFGPYALKDMEIASIGSRPDTRYGILMDKGNIAVIY